MSAQLREEWRRLEREHGHLKILFGALENTSDRDAAVGTVMELEKWLENHFRREERAGGLLDSITGQPEEVEAIREEHGAIQTILVQTRELLHAAQAIRSDLVREATAQLGTALREHEARERALIEGFLASRS